MTTTPDATAAVTDPKNIYLKYVSADRLVRYQGPYTHDDASNKYDIDEKHIARSGGSLELVYPNELDYVVAVEAVAAQ